MESSTASEVSNTCSLQRKEEGLKICFANSVIETADSWEERPGRPKLTETASTRKREERRRIRERKRGTLEEKEFIYDLSQKCITKNFKSTNDFKMPYCIQELPASVKSLIQIKTWQFTNEYATSSVRSPCQARQAKSFSQLHAFKRQYSLSLDQ